MSNNDITFFGQTSFRGKAQRFGIRPDDRRRHMYVIGKTGMGKSALLENMVIQDINNGNGVAYVDPHGDTAEKILNYIPPHRINDVVYINPADMGFPVAFNILENVNQSQKHLVASGLMGVFTKIWANLWSARMEYILNNTILALLEVPGNTLLGIMRMLNDKSFRKKIVSQIKDPIVKAFWTEEFANWNERFRTEAIQPIQNKVGQFLSSSIIRNIVGQSKSTINMREIMDDGKILILNLSKGRIGEDASALLGAMMITKIQLAAMSRVDIPVEDDRKDFFLYVDEFQNFSTESFASILSEARKYRLDITLAHQYIAQLSEEVQAAVFGNVGTMISFRVGAEDADSLEKEFTPEMEIKDLVNLNKYQIALKLMIDGVASRPFTAGTLPPLQEGKYFPENHDKVINVSRERYTKPAAEVEERLINWLSPEASAREAGKSAVTDEEEETYDHSAPRETEKEPNAECDNCDTKLFVPFTPDDKRNVFCKDCLKKFKDGEINTATLTKKNVPKKVETQAAPPADPNVITPESFKAMQQQEKDSDPKDSAPVEDAKAVQEPKSLSLEDALHQDPVSFSKK